MALLLYKKINFYKKYNIKKIKIIQIISNKNRINKNNNYN